MPSAAGTAANPSGKVSKAVAKQQQQQAAKQQPAAVQPAAVQPAATNGVGSQAKQTTSGKVRSGHTGRLGAHTVIWRAAVLVKGRRLAWCS